jgi:(R,R)-butanediol dehydrogenase/meso-butanediol dehydrogenase/diacetyl reductase
MPSPGPSTVVVEIALCGVCGSDAASWHSGAGRAAVFGHEWVGRVGAVGSDVGTFAVGDRVILAVPESCGTCRYCGAGLPDECDHVYDAATCRDRDAPTNSGFSTAVAVHASRLLRVPDSMPDEVAAMVEPTAVVVHGLRRCDAPSGAAVVVQGGGPIGLIAAQVARAMGAAQVLVVEPHEARRRLALEVGADQVMEPGADVGSTVLSRTRGRGADLVIECTGSPSLVPVAAALARRGGTLLLLGYPKGPVEVDLAAWMRTQLELRTSLAYQRHDFDVALDLISRGAVDVTALHTATIGLDELADLLGAMTAGRSAELKVLVDPARPSRSHDNTTVRET